MRVSSELSLWKANLVVFSSLFLVVIVTFWLQAKGSRDHFMSDVRNQAEFIGSILRLHAENAVKGMEITDEILRRHMKNIASFIDYLDSIEAFKPRELEAFSRKTGLHSIAILDPNKGMVSNISRWTASFPWTCNATKDFWHDYNRHFIFLKQARDQGRGCIIIAISSNEIEGLQREIGLESAMSMLKGLRGILDVEVFKSTGGPFDRPEFTLEDNPPMVTIFIPVGQRKIKVLLDASHYRNTIERLWIMFILSSLLVFVPGAILSYWLYKKQRAEMDKAVMMEKEMARQREEAMIGRAAATIAHEVRNPLNAAFMGVQRLKMEGEICGADASRIADLSLNSIRHANEIISNLLEFSRPVKPSKKPVDLGRLMEDVLLVYDFDSLGISLDLSLPSPPVFVYADPRLLKQVLHNIVKNAVEAQPNGGEIRVEVIETQESWIVITVENRGEIPDEEDLSKVLEPYYTTKTKGSGIGLPFSKRIINAHGGVLKVDVVDGNFFRVEISLPKWGGSDDNPRG